MNEISFKRKKSFDYENPKIFSTEWANDILKFGISVLNGNHGWKRGANFKSRLDLVHAVKDKLLKKGFEHKAKILQHWIQKTLKDLESKARSSTKKRKKENST